MLTHEQLLLEIEHLRQEILALQQHQATLEQQLQQDKISRLAEIELDKLLAALNDTIIIFDLNGQYIQQFQDDPSRIYKPMVKRIGKTVHEVLPEAQAHLFLETIQRVLFTQHSHQIEYCLPFNGHKKYLLGTASPFLQAQVLWVERDITEQKQAQQALRTSEAQLRALFEAFNDTIIIFDQEGRYLQQIQNNPALIYKPNMERLGKTVSEVLPAPEARLFLDGIQRALFTQNSVQIEYSLPIRGKNKWFLASASPFLEDRVVWVERDVTELKLSQEALRLEQEKSERFLLNILPQEIVDTLKDEHQSIANHFDEATILFADIVGFTEMSSRVSPTELVAILNRIFSVFDHLCEKHNLEKIKTIGDAYMVVGGIPNPRPDHAEAVADMAIDMLQAISCFHTSDQQQLAMRIGINTGAVVAVSLVLKSLFMICGGIR